MSEPHSTFEATTRLGETYRLEMIYDESAPSPREDRENLGTMIYSHRRYNLGDERITAGSFADYLHEKGMEVGDVVSLPLYLYDHSGLALSTNDFNDEWDSGCVGAIYVSVDKIREEYGKVDEETIAKAREVLRAEVEEMHNYVAGNVFGFRLSLAKEGSTDFEEVDSCWGFMGADPRTNGMIDHLPTEVATALAPVIAQKLGRHDTEQELEQTTLRAPRIR